MLIGEITLTELVDVRDRGSLDAHADIQALVRPCSTVFRAKDPIHDFVMIMREPENVHLPIAPVTDDVGCLVGCASMHEALRQAKILADQAASAMSALDIDGASYSKLSVWRLIRKRIGWLLLLIVVNVSSAGLVSAFDKVLEENVALAYFIPLLIGMGGNTGAQIATLLVSAFSSKDLSPRDFWFVFNREFVVAFVMSVPLAVVGFFVGLLVTGLDILVSLSVSVTMFTLINFSNVLGLVLPFVCAYFRIDPAVVASPMITSIIDVAGLAIYVGIALLFISPGHA